MASHDAIAAGLLELRGLFPSLPDDEVFLRGLVDDLDGYDNDEFALAVRRIRSTRKRMQGAPTNADFGEACAAIALVRRAAAVRSRREDAGTTAYCPACGTTALTWSPLWPNGKARMVPEHHGGCPRFNAEARVSAPVNMASWPSLKPRTAEPVAHTRGLAALANVLPEVAP